MSHRSITTLDTETYRVRCGGLVNSQLQITLSSTSVHSDSCIWRPTGPQL